MTRRRPSGRKTAMQAREDAQRIAFGPIAFQAARSLRELGLLAALNDAGSTGITLSELAQRCELPEYGVRVLLEAGLAMELVEKNSTDDAEHWVLEKTGYFLLADEMTRANMDFNQHVCYRAIEKLSDSVKSGEPEGLAQFGQWDSIYQALSSLPEQVRQSWFAFDHYYSDRAFPEVVDIVRADAPATMLDIGGNTGKWAIYCASRIENIHITIADLPGQLEVAKEKVTEAGLQQRVDFAQVDLLDASQPLPGDFDSIWMSQFLDCFNEDGITAIVERCHAALKPGGTMYILEHFWDEQPHRIGSYCLQMTSPYFTAIANGTSQMYRSTVFEPCVERAGFEIAERINGRYWGHTLLKCKAAAGR